MAGKSECTQGGGPAQPVIYRFAKPAVGNRCDTDNGGACGVGCMHHLEQIGSGVLEVALGAQIESEFTGPAGLAKPCLLYTSPSPRD